MLKILHLKRPLCLGLIFAFLLNINPLPIHAQVAQGLPKRAVMMHLSSPVSVAMLKGIKVHSDNPFRFDFILDPGYSSVADAHNLRQESSRLIKYFLASLTTPEADLWVNLSPYEKNRIVPESFGQTEMGRDLLAQDYMLKQITASLMYPEDEVGKRFWTRIYEEAAKRYGHTNIPVNTFNKVWIVPEKAVVYENKDVAYITESHLKVMLEEDYLAKKKVSDTFLKGESDKKVSDTLLGGQIIREIIIPELTKEVNEGANFAHLRQVYSSLILATWYKKKIKDSILAKTYAEKNKIEGLKYPMPTRGHIQNKTNKNLAVRQAGVSPSSLPSNKALNVEATQRNEPFDIETIYHHYLHAFKKGAYNYIKEERDLITQQPISRKYFSGGCEFGKGMDAAMSVQSRSASEILEKGKGHDLQTVSVTLQQVHAQPPSVIPTIPSELEIQQASQRLEEIWQELLTESTKQYMSKPTLEEEAEILEDLVNSLLRLVAGMIVTQQLSIKLKQEIVPTSLISKQIIPMLEDKAIKGDLKGPAIKAALVLVRQLSYHKKESSSYEFPTAQEELYLKSLINIMRIIDDEILEEALGILAVQKVEERPRLLISLMADIQQNSDPKVTEALAHILMRTSFPELLENGGFADQQEYLNILLSILKKISVQKDNTILYLGYCLNRILLRQFNQVSPEQITILFEKLKSSLPSSKLSLAIALSTALNKVPSYPMTEDRWHCLFSLLELEEYDGYYGKIINEVLLTNKDYRPNSLQIDSIINKMRSVNSETSILELTEVLKISLERNKEYKLERSKLDILAEVIDFQRKEDVTWRTNLVNILTQEITKDPTLIDYIIDQVIHSNDERLKVISGYSQVLAKVLADFEEIKLTQEQVHKIAEHIKVERSHTQNFLILFLGLALKKDASLKLSKTQASRIIDLIDLSVQQGIYNYDWNSHFDDDRERDYADDILSVASLTIERAMSNDPELKLSQTQLNTLFQGLVNSTDGLLQTINITLQRDPTIDLTKEQIIKYTHYLSFIDDLQLPDEFDRRHSVIARSLSGDENKFDETVTVLPTLLKNHRKVLIKIIDEAVEMNPKLIDIVIKYLKQWIQERKSDPKKYQDLYGKDVDEDDNVWETPMNMFKDPYFISEIVVKYVNKHIDDPNFSIDVLNTDLSDYSKEVKSVLSFLGVSHHLIVMIMEGRLTKSLKKSKGNSSSFIEQFYEDIQDKKESQQLLEHLKEALEAKKYLSPQEAEGIKGIMLNLLENMLKENRENIRLNHQQTSAEDAQEIIGVLISLIKHYPQNMDQTFSEILRMMDDEERFLKKINQEASSHYQSIYQDFIQRIVVEMVANSSSCFAIFMKTLKENANLSGVLVKAAKELTPAKIAKGFNVNIKLARYLGVHGGFKQILNDNNRLAANEISYNLNREQTSHPTQRRLGEDEKTSLFEYLINLNNITEAKRIFDLYFRNDPKHYTLELPILIELLNHIKIEQIKQIIRAVVEDPKQSLDEIKSAVKLNVLGQPNADFIAREMEWILSNLFVLQDKIEQIEPIVQSFNEQGKTKDAFISFLTEINKASSIIQINQLALANDLETIDVLKLKLDSIAQERKEDLIVDALQNLSAISPNKMQEIFLELIEQFSYQSQASQKRIFFKLLFSQSTDSITILKIINELKEGNTAVQISLGASQFLSQYRHFVNDPLFLEIISEIAILQDPHKKEALKQLRKLYLDRSYSKTKLNQPELTRVSHLLGLMAEDLRLVQPMIQIPHVFFEPLLRLEAKDTAIETLRTLMQAMDHNKSMHDQLATLKNRLYEKMKTFLTLNMFSKNKKDQDWIEPIVFTNSNFFIEYKARKSKSNNVSMSSNSKIVSQTFDRIIHKVNEEFKSLDETNTEKFYTKLMYYLECYGKVLDTYHKASSQSFSIPDLNHSLKILTENILDDLLSRDHIDDEKMNELLRHLSLLIAEPLIASFKQKITIENENEVLQKLSAYAQHNPRFKWRDHLGRNIFELINIYLRTINEKEIYQNMFDALMAEVEGRFSQWKNQSQDYLATIDEIINIEVSKLPEDKQKEFEAKIKSVEGQTKYDQLQKISGFEEIKDRILKIKNWEKFLNLKVDEELDAEFTDDFYSLFNMGNYSGSTACQSCTYGTDLNRGLAGYTVNGTNKALALFDQDKRIVSTRRTVRLRILESVSEGNQKTLREPVILVEENTQMGSKYIDTLYTLLAKLSKEMNVPIAVAPYRVANSIKLQRGNRVNEKVIVFKGRSSFDYSDYYGRSVAGRALGGLYEHQGQEPLSVGPLEFIIKHVGFDLEKRFDLNIGVLDSQSPEEDISLAEQSPLVHMVSVIGPTPKQILHHADYFYKPQKVSYSLDLPQVKQGQTVADAMEEYYQRFDSHQRRQLKSDVTKINEAIERKEASLVMDTGENTEDFKEFLKLYEKTMDEKERGRKPLLDELDTSIQWDNPLAQAVHRDDNIKNFFKNKHTAIYLKKDGKIIGGVVVKKMADYNSISYAATGREYRGIQFYLIQSLMQKSIEEGFKTLSYAVDRNLYGHHLSPGLMQYKTRLGFNPRLMAFSEKELIKIKDYSVFTLPVFFFTLGKDGSLESTLIVDDQNLSRIKEFQGITPKLNVRILRDGKLESHDLAMIDQHLKTPGGIDLNPSKWDLQTQGQADNFKIPANMVNVQNMSIDGFTPIIIQIAPTDLPRFLGMESQEKFQVAA